ncbi:MAG: hypothetical protein R3C11_13660 [Planctomycetaceae bacterium]
MFRDHSVTLFCFSLFAGLFSNLDAAEPFHYQDANPQQYNLSARASEIDSRAKEYPAIDFVFGTNEKPQDLEHASVDTSVAPPVNWSSGWMGHNQQLFDRLSSYGLHAIQVHYARAWFGILAQEKPVGEHARGNIRLEATTGEDFSDELDLAYPDGMKERALQFVKWLAKEHPQGNWEYFINEAGDELRWDDVIMRGRRMVRLLQPGSPNIRR